jgi:cob(I)alamin adenosyltransferase
VRLSGTVAYRDLETGVWVLVGDDGTTYLLAGGDRKIKKNGARIQAEGEVDSASATLAMVGPRFVVRSYSFLT